MKNVTVSMDEETASWARIEAARRGVSVSRLIGEMLKERRRLQTDYVAAADRFLGRQPKALKSGAERYPTRDDLYDRDLVR